MDGTPAGRRRLGRESIAGHRRNHDVERVLGFAAVRRGVAERADHVEHLDHRAGPPVGDDQGQRVLVRRPDVDEVDVESVDLGQELRERVQPRLEPAEVVVVAPVSDELPHSRQGHALRLIGDGLLLGETRRRQASAQVVELLLGNADLEGADRAVLQVDHLVIDGALRCS